MLASCTCSEPPTLNAEVIDLWGQPVDGATVHLDKDKDGAPEPGTTDVTGMSAFELPDGEHALSASKEAYIGVTKVLDIEAGEDSIQVQLQLWPEPPGPGLFFIGESSYEKLDPQAVDAKGNDLRMFYGVASSGTVSGGTSDFRVVFNTDLKMDEVMRLGYELHKLEYVMETTIDSPEGELEVDVNLWTVAKEYDIGFEELGSPNNYLITPEEELEPGTYAFQAFDVLTPGTYEAFSKLHADIRQAYTFEVK
jgi:hypothetical protein